MCHGLIGDWVKDGMCLMGRLVVVGSVKLVHFGHGSTDHGVLVWFMRRGLLGGFHPRRWWRVCCGVCGCVFFDWGVAWLRVGLEKLGELGYGAELVVGRRGKVKW